MLGTRRITALNDALTATLARPQVRELVATAADGLVTQAWALTPPGTGPWPTVLYVHGGPYGAFGSVYMIDFQLLAGAGFAVVFHNFRGSYGYGADFFRKITGDWGPGGALDHHAAVDAAIAAGIADPGRAGVCGLSYGGFATCWLVGTSDRFRAAVAENPCTDFATMYGRADAPGIHPEGTRRDSGPAPRRLPRRLTPDLRAGLHHPLPFIVGEDDLRCPPGESEQYHRVLKANGVPTEMPRLPGSAHIGTANGPVAARAEQNAALVDWFQRHLT